jgi:hypothetical protein
VKFPAQIARRGGFEPERGRMKREISANRRSLFAFRQIHLKDLRVSEAPHKLDSPQIMSQIIPLISSGTAGPLGVLHLPRLWQKASLGAAGKLHSDYPSCGQGYDQMVLSALGLDKAAFESFIAEEKPTYPQLEAWVLAQSGGALDAAAVAKLNAAIIGYNHADDVRASILGACGIPDEGKLLDAINLNNLDDWQSFHRQVIVG